MTLQAKLDAFKADFEAGKPPYNVPLSVIETMHRATDELIASGAATRALKAGDRRQPSRSRIRRGAPSRPPTCSRKVCWLSASIAVSGVPIATWNSRRFRQRCPNSKPSEPG